MRLRIKVTPPARLNGVPQPGTGEVRIQEIADDGTLGPVWPATMIESVADMRMVVRPSGDSRVRIQLEAGLEALQMDSPKLDQV